MSFYDICRRHPLPGPGPFFGITTGADIGRALDSETPDERDLLSLLSPDAGAHIELLARRANELTLRHFGKVIHLYAPLYLANFCDNECVYCGFRRSSRIDRKKLSLEEVEAEAEALAASGLRHILILTGESRTETPVGFIRDSVGVLKRYFSSISIEVHPLGQDEYSELVLAGADGLAIYQETYDETLYRRLHRAGPKRDYRYRLDAPERACLAGMRAVNVGALLGLSDFRREVFLTGLHAAYLQHKYPGVEVSVSLPRLRPQTGGVLPEYAALDRDLVQAMTALRIFLPRAGITISTREPAALRKNLIGLGTTRMSAGSRTGVGGYASGQDGGEQFRVADENGVENVKAMIRARGYQPVMKDWQVL